MSQSREEQAILAARLRQLRPSATVQPSPPVIPPSGIAEDVLGSTAQPPVQTRTIVVGGKGHPEERLQALIDVAPYVPAVEPAPKQVLVGGKGRFEERMSISQPMFEPFEASNYLDIRDENLEAFVKRWAGTGFVTEGRYAPQINRFIYEVSMNKLRFAQIEAFKQSELSRQFYGDIDYFQYATKYQPFTIPSGMKVFEITETLGGLNVSFMPADLTKEEFLLFQKIEEVKAAGRQEFYEGIGYPELAQKYESFLVPEGYRVAEVKETLKGLEVAFSPAVEPPESLAERLYGGKVPSLGVRQAMLGDLDRFLVLGKTSELPWKFVAGFVGSFEAPVYSIGKLLGIPGLPSPPVGAIGGVISSFTFGKTGLGLFEKGLILAEGMSQAEQKIYSTMREHHAPAAYALNVGFAPGAELKQVVSLGPEYVFGSVAGDIALAYLSGKAIQKVGSAIVRRIEPAIARQVDTAILKTYRAESYTGFTKGQLPYEGKLSFSKFMAPAESGESFLGRAESWILRRTHLKLPVGQVSIPVGEVYEGGKYLVRPETLAATDIGWGLIEAPRMGGIMVTKVPTETVLKGLPVYFGLGTELLSSGMAYEETFMFKGGKAMTTKPFETVKPVGSFEKLPYALGYEGQYAFEKSMLPTVETLLKTPAQRSALETAFLKQFLSEPFTGSVTHSYAWAYWLSKTFLETFPRQTFEPVRTTAARIERPQTVQKQLEKLAVSPLFAETVQGFIPYAEQKEIINLVQYAGKPYPGTAKYAEEWLGFEVLHYPGQALSPQIETVKIVSKVSPTSMLIQDVWQFDKEMQRHWMRQAQQPVIPLEQQLKQLSSQVETGVVTPDVKAFQGLAEVDRALLLPRVFVSGRYKPVQTAVPISSLEVMQRQAAKILQVRGLQRGFYGGIYEGRPKPPYKFRPEDTEFKKRFGLKAKKLEYPYRRYERFWPVMGARQARTYLLGGSNRKRRGK